MKRLYCYLFGHKLEVWQRFTPQCRRIICMRCGGDWGFHDGVGVAVPWDNDLEDFHSHDGRVPIYPLPAGFKKSK